MNRPSTTLHRRINISLPEDTVRLIERAAKKGDKSRLVNEAVRYFLREFSRIQLAKRLEEGAIQRAERDRRLAEEWFLLEKGAWKSVRK